MRIKISLLLVCLLGTSGCFIKNRKKLPAVDLPCQFSYQNKTNSTENLQDWWRLFDNSELDMLIQRGLEHNLDLAIAIEKIEELRAQYKVSRADLFPQIGAVAAGGKIKPGKNDLFSFSRGREPAFYFLGFDASWEVDLRGKIWFATAGAYYNVRAQIEAARGVQIMLIADIARVYVDICALSKNAQLLAQIVAYDERIAYLTQALFTSGLNNEIDLEKALADVNVSRSNFLQNKILLEQSHHQLAYLLGSTRPVDIHCAAVPRLEAFPESGLPSDLLRRRPDIRQAEAALAASSEFVKSALADWFPSFTLFSALGTAANKLSKTFDCGSLAWLIFPALQYPIITFGKITATINTKKSQERQAIYSYSQTVINAFKDVENSLVAYFESRRETVEYEQRFMSLARIFSLQESKQEAGLANERDLLLAQKQRDQAELDFIGAQQLQTTNLIGLYKALGGGWAP